MNSQTQIMIQAMMDKRDGSLGFVI